MAKTKPQDYSWEESLVRFVLGCHPLFRLKGKRRTLLLTGRKKPQNTRCYFTSFDVLSLYDSRPVQGLEREMSVSQICKRRSLTFTTLIKCQKPKDQGLTNTILCGKLCQICDHGNMVQHRYYWSDPYHGLADALSNQAFWSPTPPPLEKHFKSSSSSM